MTWSVELTDKSGNRFYLRDADGALTRRAEAALRIPLRRAAETVAFEVMQRNEEFTARTIPHSGEALAPLASAVYLSSDARNALNGAIWSESRRAA